MNLDDAQKRTVAEWIAQGLKLSEIQKRLSEELGLHLTYMEIRLLVDDLKLTPKDTEPPKPVQLPGKPGAADLHAPGAEDKSAQRAEAEIPQEQSTAGSRVSVEVD